MDISKIFEDAKRDPTLLSKINIEELLRNSEPIEYLANTSLKEINTIKLEKIKEFTMDPNTLIDLCSRVSEYKYIDEIFEIKCGKYIRTIPISYLPPTLSRGGIVVGIDFTDTGTYLLCKNNCNRIFKVGFDKHLIFQKLSEDELLYLTASEYIGR